MKAEVPRGKSYGSMLVVAVALSDGAPVMTALSYVELRAKIEGD